PPHARGDEKHKGNDHERGNGKGRIQRKHNDNDTGQDQHVHQDVDHTVGKQFLQRVDVVDDTHEDRPGRAGVKKVKRQVLNVAKQPLANVPQDLLTHPVGKLDAHTGG